MKTLLLTSSMILCVTSVQAIEVDKFAHAVGSYGLTHATQAICNRVTEGEHKTACLVTGIAVAAAAGAAKEIIDQKRGTNTPKQSLEDGAADLAGIGLAVLMIKIDF